MCCEGLRIPLIFLGVHAGWLHCNFVDRNSPSPVDEALSHGPFQPQVTPDHPTFLTAPWLLSAQVC